MNIKFKKGNLFQSDAEAVVNTVNCVGVMGKGIAKEVKSRYPSVYDEYRLLCNAKQMKPGIILTTPTNELIGPKYVVNFPTKRHWKNNSRIDDIKLGLNSLVKEIEKFQFKSLAIPPLGCGNGGLNWADVKPLIIEALKEVKGTEITIFEPKDYIEQKIVIKSTEDTPKPTEDTPKLTEDRMVLLNLLLLYSEENFAVSINEIHNLAYILQSSGENLDILGFEKNNTGVMSKPLNPVLKKLDNHYFNSYSSKGKTSYVKFSDKLIIEKLKSNQEINQYNIELLELLKGFKNEAGIELFAKVLWELRNVEKENWETKFLYLHSSIDKKEVLKRIDTSHMFRFQMPGLKR